MSEYLTKSPSQSQACAVLFDGLQAGETVAEDLGWFIVPQELASDGLRLAGASLAGPAATAVLSGGRAGHVYHVSCRVRTSRGRVLSRAVLVQVAASEGRAGAAQEELSC